MIKQTHGRARPAPPPHAEAGAAPHPAHQWLILATCTLSFSTFHANRTLFAALLPELMRRFGGSYLLATTLANAFDVGYMATLILGGMVAARIGRQMSIVTGLALLAVASLASGLAVADFNTLFVMRLLGGLGFSLYFPAGQSLLARTFPSNPGTAFGLHGGGSAAGRVYGPWLAKLGLAAGSVALAFHSFAWLLFAVAGAAAVVLLLTTGWRAREEQAWGNPFLLLRERRLWIAVAVSAVAFTTFLSALAFWPLYLVDVLHMPSATAATVLSVLNLASLLGAVGAGRISDRTGAAPVIAIVFLMLAAGLLSMRWATTMPAVVGLTVAVGLGISANFQVAIAYLARGGRRFSGPVVFGVLNTLSLGLGLAGTFVMGTLGDLAGLNAVFLALGVLMAVSAAAFWRLLQPGGA